MAQGWPGLCGPGPLTLCDSCSLQGTARDSCGKASRAHGIKQRDPQQQQQQKAFLQSVCMRISKVTELKRISWAVSSGSGQAGTRRGVCVCQAHREVWGGVRQVRHLPSVAPVCMPRRLGSDTMGEGLSGFPSSESGSHAQEMATRLSARKAAV